MKKMKDLSYAFMKRIKCTAGHYKEVTIIFDQYLENSLKMKTMGKRTGAVNTINFEIHDETIICKISLKELLSSSQTKT